MRYPVSSGLIAVKGIGDIIVPYALLFIDYFTKEMPKQFDEYKNEYSRKGTTEDRKKELIGLMQENLKNRGEYQTVFCINDQEFSIDSKNVEDLYAIDGFLRQEESQKEMSASAEMARQKALSNNKYGPNNPYPSKKS